MKILVPVDGSKSALNAVKYAAKLSGNLRSTDTVTLITVHDDHGLRHAKQFVGKAKVDDYLRELSHKELKSSLAVLKKADIRYSTIIQTGHVAEVIANTANKSFDMVIMGTKGRSALADLLIGSIAQRVVASCKKPVVLVK